MTGKNKVYVRIAGKDYTLVGVESDEYIQKVAMYIDKKMQEIMKVNSKLSTSMAAVLTAINVADDYVKAHESEFHLKKELKHINEEVDKIKDENRKLLNEIAALSGKGTNLQLELAKREAELHEVRSTIKNSNRNEM